MGKSVVIAGIGKKHCGIPAYRPGMEVWGINDAYDHCKEVTRWFKIYQIHKNFPELLEERTDDRFKDWKNRSAKTKALFITAKDLGLPKQRIIDITKLINDNPDYCFCCTASYAIFEAVTSGYKEIRLYRISMNDSEHLQQAVGVISNIRWAQSKGVKVYYPWAKYIMEEIEKRGTEKDWKKNQDVVKNYGDIDEPKPVETKPKTKRKPRKSKKTKEVK